MSMSLHGCSHVDCDKSVHQEYRTGSSSKGNGSSVAWLRYPDDNDSHLCITGSFLEGFPSASAGTRQVNLPGFLVPQDQDLAKWHC